MFVHHQLAATTERQSWYGQYRSLIHVSLILVLGASIYGGTFQVPFYFDDFACIVSNPVVHDFSAISELSEFRQLGLSEDLRNNVTTRLVTYASFALNYRLHGLDPTGYHVVNLLIHLANGLLLYNFVLLAAGRLAATNSDHDRASTLALITALFFVVHPIQTNAVTYIVQRFASLAAFFYLAAFVSYIKAATASRATRRRLFYACSVLSAILGMYTKEIVFTLPVMIALYDLTFLDAGRRSRLWRLLPLLSTMLLIPATVMTLASLSTVTDGEAGKAMELANITGISRWEYFITQWRVIVTYLRLLILPVELNLDYDYPTYASALAPEVLFSGLLVATLFVLGLYFLLRCWCIHQMVSGFDRLVGFGLVWFFVTLSISSSIIPLDDMIFEYRLYLPSVGFILAGVSMADEGLRYAARRFARPQLKSATIVFTVLLVATLSTATVLRNHLWRYEKDFWLDVIRKSPNKARPYCNLGNYYLRNGQVDEALALYEQAKSRKPCNGIVQLFIGKVLITLGQFERAAEEYKEAVRLAPKNIYFHLALADAYMLLGRDSEAQAVIEEAAALAPNQALTFLGRAESPATVYPGS